MKDSCIVVTGSAMNPSWAVLDPTETAGWANVNINTYMGLRFSLADAVRTKLASIDTSQSKELKRFVTLTAHELAHYEVDWSIINDFGLSSRSKIYYPYRGPFPQLQDFAGVFHKFLRPDEVEFLQSREILHLRGFFILNLVFDLIDRVVDYWNEVALARRAWRSFSGAFRQFLESALQFKPFRTPLRLFPSSIHPIGLAA